MLVQYTVVFVLGHPALKAEPIGVYLSDPIHVAFMQVIPEGIPPAREVLRPTGRTCSSLCSNWLFGVFHMGEPHIEGLAVVLGLLPRHLCERCDEVIPADPLGRDF